MQLRPSLDHVDAGLQGRKHGAKGVQGSAKSTDEISEPPKPSIRQVSSGLLSCLSSSFINTSLLNKMLTLKLQNLVTVVVTYSEVEYTCNVLPSSQTFMLHFGTLSL